MIRKRSLKKEVGVEESTEIKHIEVPLTPTSSTPESSEEPEVTSVQSMDQTKTEHQDETEE